MGKSRRYPSETFTLHLTGGELPDRTLVRHTVEVSLSYEAGQIRDIIFVGRGKIGHGLDLMLSDLGIQLSRLVQGRAPDDTSATIEYEPRWDILSDRRRK